MYQYIVKLNIVEAYNIFGEKDGTNERLSHFLLEINQCTKQWHLLIVQRILEYLH